MPQNTWIIKDTNTGLFLYVYALSLDACQWGSNPYNAVTFISLAACDIAIEQWGETEEGRFIGQNPPPR